MVQPAVASQHRTARWRLGIPQLLDRPSQSTTEREWLWPPTPSSLTLGSPLIPNSALKPIRFWFEVGDRDLWYPNPLDDGMHDWVLANENMAKALADKGYHYQFIVFP